MQTWKLTSRSSSLCLCPIRIRILPPTTTVGSSRSSWKLDNSSLFILEEKFQMPSHPSFVDFGSRDMDDGSAGGTVAMLALFILS
jgi:hypothetical protein